MTLIEQYHSHNPDFIDPTHRDILFWKEFKRKSHPATELKCFHKSILISVLETFRAILLREFIFHMNYVIEGIGCLVNEKGEEQPLKAGDFALVNPDEKLQYRNKGDVLFKMICGVPKEFE